MDIIKFMGSKRKNCKSNYTKMNGKIEKDIQMDENFALDNGYMLSSLVPLSTFYRQ